MVVDSFHLEKPRMTSSSVTSMLIGIESITMRVTVKAKRRNSLKSWSSPCQSGGRIPFNNSFASGDRLVKVSASKILPLPHCEDDAARKASRLKFRRCLSMSSFETTVSHIRSVGSLSSRI